MGWRTRQDVLVPPQVLNSARVILAQVAAGDGVAYLVDIHDSAKARPPAVPVLGAVAPGANGMKERVDVKGGARKQLCLVPRGHVVRLCSDDGVRRVNGQARQLAHVVDVARGAWGLRSQKGHGLDVIQVRQLHAPRPSRSTFTAT